MKFFSSFTVLFLGLFNSPIFLSGQTAGTPDLNFGQAGQVVIQDPPNTYYGGPTVLLPDGKLIIAGFDQSSLNGVLVFTRLMPDGTLDITYGTNGQARPDIGIGIDGTLRKIALTTDNKVIVVGKSKVGNLRAAFAARINSNGVLDSSFGQNGMALFDLGSGDDEFWTVLLKPDGRILLGGSTSDPSNPFDDLLLVQVLPDGTPDQNFGIGGIATADFAVGAENIQSLSLQADGKIVAVGNNSVEYFDMQVVRFFPNGTLDLSFANNGAFIFANEYHEDLAFAGAVQADQKIVFCGMSVLNNTSLGHTTLFRLNPDGSFDSTFGVNGQVFTDLGILSAARSLVLQPDGKILVGARSSELLPSSKGWHWVLRYNSDGSLDANFGSGGKVQTPDTYSPQTSDLLIQPDGKIIHTGTAEGKLVLWRYLNDQMVGLEERPNIDFQIQLSPNVVAGHTQLTWVLQSPCEVQCDLFDAQGRLLKTIITPTIFTSGRQEAALYFGNEVVPGTYFLKFNAGGEHRIIKFVKI